LDRDDFVIEHMLYEKGPMGVGDGKLKHTVRHGERAAGRCVICVEEKLEFVRP